MFNQCPYKIPEDRRNLKYWELCQEPGKVFYTPNPNIVNALLYRYEPTIDYKSLYLTTLKGETICSW